MNGTGVVEQVFVAPEPEAEMRAVSSVEAVVGSGLRGDRYFDGSGTFVDSTTGDDRGSGYDLTLIEREAVEAIAREAGVELGPGEHRRNVETRDVALNHLVGRRFRVGEVVCQGDRLCEPCEHLQSLTAEGVLPALVHRGGLRADVVSGGTIHAGDAVVPIE